MSLRTTPLSPSASGPLEPSPGNGPPVSSGMIVQSVIVAAVEPTVVVVAPDVVDVVDDTPLVVAVAFELSLPPEQPAATSPSPPRSASAPRRDTGLVRRAVGLALSSVMPTGCPPRLHPT